MYLKRLDLQGFKSFPEKVKLEFNPGVTAVVGPNGSGKSNVSDAVRWVLGEQRVKSLRGDKMEDVIFAGTENRKPLGFAEVSITIDNQDKKLSLDFSEVRVTRRVFRSGESEYRINGTPCRLKDIQELFMDTGVGREGYSIIGQGRIDEILSAKGEERRRIFEEAAGIVKYKTRRNEANSKLEKEQQNLIRVNDIITELEVQLAPLEEQSEKAKKYLLLKEELKQAEVVSFCKDADGIENQLARLEGEHGAAQNQMQEFMLVSEAEREKVSALRTKTEELEHVLQGQTEAITLLREEKEKKEGEIRLAEEQRQNDSENIRRIQGEIAQKEEKIKENAAQLELQNSRIVALHIEMDGHQQKLSALEELYVSLNTALDRDESQAASFKDEIFEQIRVGTEAKGELAKIEAMKQQFVSRQNQLLQEKEQVEGRLHQFEIHLQALEKQEQDMKNHIVFLENDLQALEKDREHALGLKNEAKRQAIEQERNISEIQSRLKLLQEMERENDGFYHSVKSLLNLPNREDKGICGAVGQLFKVDEAYELAIESALGAAVQNVVTKTEEYAKEAIRYLKEQRLGRATFLPISAIRGNTFQGHPLILDELGVVGVGHELVEVDEEYSEIAKYLLGRTVIVENLDTSVILAKKYKHQYKLVTLEGDILNPGGAMTGGSIPKKTMHIFGRGREIRQLQEKLEGAVVLEMKLREKAALAGEDLDEIEEAAIEKKMEMQKIVVTMSSGSGEKTKSIQDKEEIQERLRLMLLEEDQLSAQLNRAEEDRTRTQSMLEHSEKSMEESNTQLLAFQDSLSGEKEKRDGIAQQITRIKMDLTALGQNTYAVEEALLRLRTEKAEIERERKNALSQIAVYERSGGIKEEQKGDLRQQADRIVEKIADLQCEYNQNMTQKSEIAETIMTTEESAQEKRESAAKMENELFRIKTKQEKLEEEKIRLATQMWEEYEMTYRMAKEYSEHLPEEIAKRPAKEWRAKIRVLGDINVGAIEQFKEVQERYLFLTKQRDDILAAEDKLQKIIEELTVLMEKQFGEQFALISQNFSHVFQELFGGGKAYLKLADANNVLESAIEIVAQPPGKNLQNMQLLSGGERALTAIAILFSILELKPSPFCVLDEIEAALDDANVGRYAQYLKKFSKETQFIVITHRKGTMEYADVLYGVTMQEKGISKMISVDFTETNKEAI